MAFPFPLKQILSIVLIIFEISFKASSRSLSNENPTYHAQAFEDWLVKHDKTYYTSEEREKRFSLFKESLDHIEWFNNNKKHNFTLGLNAFSDMSFEEFDETYGCETDDAPEMNLEIEDWRYRNDEDFEELNNHKNWDWREKGAVTNVKNQYSCGGCYAFATVGAVEGLTPFYNKPYGRLMNLSAQEIISCSKPYGNKGCISGKVPIAMNYVRENGLFTEENFPYDSAEQSCNKDSQSLPDMKISGYGFVDEFDEVALRKAVHRQPVAVTLSGSNAFKHYSGGIFTDADGKCGQASSNTHSSLLVGFGTTIFDEDYWILKNSWGTSWGEDGYMRIKRNNKRGRSTCSLAKLAVYPVL